MRDSVSRNKEKEADKWLIRFKKKKKSLLKKLMTSLFIVQFLETT